MSLDEDREALQELGVKYSESFMEVCQDDDPEGDPDRLWKWMAQLINDAYQVGWKSSHGKGLSQYFCHRCNKNHKSSTRCPEGS